VNEDDEEDDDEDVKDVVEENVEEEDEDDRDVVNEAEEVSEEEDEGMMTMMHTSITAQSSWGTSGSRLVASLKIVKRCLLTAMIFTSGSIRTTTIKRVHGTGKCLPYLIAVLHKFSVVELNFG
jgi:hypothetical protein